MHNHLGPYPARELSAEERALKQDFGEAGTSAWNTQFWACTDAERGCCTCCYTACCIPCAVADTRHTMDGSNWWFNFFCFGLSLHGWLVAYNVMRHGYNIEGSPGKDCLSVFCCPCFSVRRMFIEARLRGALPSYHRRQLEGAEQGKWRHSLYSCTNHPETCLMAICCPLCALASVRTQYDGSNWLFNLCCFAPVYECCPIACSILRGPL